MVKYGAELKEGEADILADYLGRYWANRPSRDRQPFQVAANPPRITGDLKGG